MIREISSRCRVVQVARLSVRVVLVIAVTCSPACRKHGDGAGQPGSEAHADDHEHEHDHAAEGVHADEVSLTVEAVEQNGIRVGEAGRHVLRPTFIAPARVSLNLEAVAHVGSPLKGRAVEIAVRLGDKVSKDAPLVVVESPELGEAQAEYLQQRAAAQASAAQVELVKAAWDRAQALYERSQGISLTEVQKREAEYRAAVATARAGEASARAAEQRLRLLGMDTEAIAALQSSEEMRPRYTIRAPLAGQVVEREVTLGELVSPERESVMVLADLSTLWVLADVPEARMPGVGVGAQAWVTLGVGERLEAKVAFVSPFIDPTTRTAQVRIEIPGTAASMRPGMFAQAEIVTGTGGGEPAPQLAVPREAVQTVEGGPAVFVPVEGEPNTFQKRAIRVGAPVGTFIPIVAGLEEGEKFVEAGSFILKAELGKGSAAHEH